LSSTSKQFPAARCNLQAGTNSGLFDMALKNLGFLGL